MNKKVDVVTIEDLISNYEPNKYALALQLMVQRVKIASLRGQSIPIGNYFTNLIESAKVSLLSGEEVVEKETKESLFI
jgi:hypothetical protein